MSENIGLKIKKIRKEKNLTQSQLAKLIDKSVITIRKWESGERTPNIETIKEIAKALEVPTFMLTDESEVINLFSGTEGLGDNSKIENLLKTLNIIKVTSDNVKHVSFYIAKDKIDLAIKLLDSHGYKATITENELVTIIDHTQIMRPFSVDIETFLNFSKNLHWAIDSFINKFIDENSNGFINEDGE